MFVLIRLLYISKTKRCDVLAIDGRSPGLTEAASSKKMLLVPFMFEDVELTDHASCSFGQNKAGIKPPIFVSGWIAFVCFGVCSIQPRVLRLKKSDFLLQQLQLCGFVSHEHIAFPFLWLLCSFIF